MYSQHLPAFELIVLINLFIHFIAFSHSIFSIKLLKIMDVDKPHVARISRWVILPLI